MVEAAVVDEVEETSPSEDVVQVADDIRVNIASEEAQQAIERTLCAELIVNARKEVGQRKIEWKLATRGLLPAPPGKGIHPNQVRDAYTEAQARLEELLAMYALTAEGVLTSPSSLEIPTPAVTKGLKSDSDRISR